ncbi:hypothetical protein K2173_001980 [Erythroxylum novogranatense]|uniref:Ribosomal protein L33 n=1 Tax=Erythroxylum novogranatense TaxID=1862640 RepID=A0AAV8SP70_9ROSI|nr:hypothetical protein K2173_001980 [Erythroxylum novogranatense]
MVGGKENRLRVILECTNCVRTSVNKKSTGISRYITQKIGIFLRRCREGVGI